MKTVKASHSRAVFLWIMGSYALLVIVAYAVHIAGARLNFTASLPRGLYWTVDKIPEKGDFVTFAPPSTALFLGAVERRYLHRSLSGVGPGLLLKRVAAAAGDTVTVDASGVTVNGRLLQNSAPLPRDAAGRDLAPRFISNYTLAEDEVFLFSEHSPNSFDSRYFGVQVRKYVKDVVRPVFIYIPKKK